MRTDLAQVGFYFPNNTGNITSKNKLAEFILDMLEKRRSIKYAGFSDKKVLYKNILGHLGNANINQYKLLSELQKREIKKCIIKTVSNSNIYLPVPTKNYIFIFPYLPTKKEAVFDGVMGFSPYSCVFYIFISPEQWSQKSLSNTVAHELNHTIFYYHHYNDFYNYTLLDEMILEGLAENFREHLLGKDPAPWALSLTQEKAFNILDTMDKETIFSKDQSLIKSILFGDDTYERWTGYSIGYWLVKKFLCKKPCLSWKSIMKLPTKEILRIVRK